jgi:predicted MFS family arabinose efflux permease
VTKIKEPAAKAVNVPLISRMIRASFQLYRNAYSGLSGQMWWLALITFINRSGTMVIPFLTVYLTSKGYSLQQAGYAMAAFGAGSILGGFVGGKTTDRFGFYYVQVVSLFLNGVLFLVLGQMQTLPQIMCCIFVLSSLGEAFRPANSAAIAAYSNDSNRTRCYSLNRLAVNLGWAIGPAVGGILASVSYNLLFWADGITCILAAMLLYFRFQNSQHAAIQKDEKQEAVVPSAYSDKTFLTGMFYIFLVGVCFFQMFSIIPVFYKENLHLNEATIGWVLAMNGLLIALFEMVLVYSLEKKSEPVKYMMMGALLIGLSFLVLRSAPYLSIVISSMIVITVGEMLLFPFMNNFWVSRSHPSNRGQYAAVYTMSFSAAIVLAPTIASQIAARAGFGSLWWFNFVVCTIAATGFYFLKNRLKT